MPGGLEQKGGNIGGGYRCIIVVHKIEADTRADTLGKSVLGQETGAKGRAGLGSGHPGLFQGITVRPAKSRFTAGLIIKRAFKVRVPRFVAVLKRAKFAAAADSKTEMRIELMINSRRARNGSSNLVGESGHS